MGIKDAKYWTYTSRYCFFAAIDSSTQASSYSFFCNCSVRQHLFLVLANINYILNTLMERLSYVPVKMSFSRWIFVNNNRWITVKTLSATGQSLKSLSKRTAKYKYSKKAGKGEDKRQETKYVLPLSLRILTSPYASQYFSSCFSLCFIFFSLFCETG